MLDNTTRGALREGHPAEPRLAPITPAAFATEMKAHWERPRSDGGLGNTANDALLMTWARIATAFETQLTNPTGTRWGVVGMPTGTGKSQGLAIYCAMLANNPGSEDAGVLIVTQFTKDADDLAEVINAHAGPGTAITKHSKAHARKVTADQLSEHRVAIVTHAAFKAMMLGFRNGRPDDAHRALLDWDRGPRVLRVINEALDVVASTRISADELHGALEALGSELRSNHREAKRMIDAAADLIDGAGKVKEAKERLLWAAGAAEAFAKEFPSREPLDALLEALHETNRRDDRASDAVSTLENLALVLTSWAWSGSDRGTKYLATGRKLVPEGLPGMIALDATAEVNLTWRFLLDETGQPPYLYDAAPGARDYSNVTAYIHRTGQRLGKEATSKQGEARLERLAANFRDHLETDDRLLLVTHKVPGWSIHEAKGRWAEAYGLREVDAAWHSNVVGRNDWQEFSAVAITSIPHPPDEIATNTIGALLATPTVDFFLDPKAREVEIDGETVDIRQRMRWSTISTQVIQAVHRVRMRRVEGPDKGRGGCKPATVFLLLPSGALGDHLEAAVLASLPGAKRCAWRIEKLDANQKAKTIKEELLEFFEEQAEAGRGYTVDDLQAALGVEKRRAIEKALEGIGDGQLSFLGVTKGRAAPNGRGTPKALWIKEEAAG